MTDLSPALLVPPVRLGRLLYDARVSQDESHADLVRRCGLAYDEPFFAAVEAGRAALDEARVRWLAALYDVPVEHLVPQRARLVIDLEEGSVAIGERATQVLGSSADSLLTSYLGLVYELRGLPNGAPLKIRELDLDVLARALELRTRAVQSKLHALMAGDREPINSARRGLRHRLVVPLAGILVGVTAAGAVLFERSGETPNPAAVSASPVTPSAAAAHDVPVEIGDAAVLVR